MVRCYEVLLCMPHQILALSLKRHFCEYFLETPLLLEFYIPSLATSF